MAKRAPKQTPAFSVKGKSVDDLLNMPLSDFNKLNKSEMRQVVQRIASAGNKRLKNFEKSGVTSPAYRHVMKTGGKFTTKGKSLNELRGEYVRAKGFFKAETGTVSGYKKVKKATIKELGKSGIKISDDAWDKFWKAYEDLKEVDPSVSEKQLKYKVLSEIADEIESDLDPDEIVQNVQDKLAEIYERNADNDTSVSGFFDVGSNT